MVESPREGDEPPIASSSYAVELRAFLHIDTHIALQSSHLLTRGAGDDAITASAVPESEYILRRYWKHR
jgi:hypothetical protein